MWEMFLYFHMTKFFYETILKYILIGQLKKSQKCSVSEKFEN